MLALRISWWIPVFVLVQKRWIKKNARGYWNIEKCEFGVVGEIVRVNNEHQEFTPARVLCPSLVRHCTTARSLGFLTFGEGIFPEDRALISRGPIPDRKWLLFDCLMERWRNFVSTIDFFNNCVAFFLKFRLNRFFSRTKNTSFFNFQSGVCSGHWQRDVKLECIKTIIVNKLYCKILMVFD